jgi:hypothetical protein
MPARRATLVSSMHHELMAALQRDPDDAGAWAVLQDWLLSQGDVRGELGVAAPERRRELLLEHGPRWFGQPVAALPNPYHPDHLMMAESREALQQRRFSLELTFARGHVHEIVILDWRGEIHRWLVPTLERILGQPVGQLTQAILVSLTRPGPHYEGLLEALVEVQPPALRVVRFQPPHEREPEQATMPDCSPLWDLSSLRQVELHGYRPVLGEVRHEQLQDIELHSTVESRDLLRPLTTAHLPSLRRLSVERLRRESLADLEALARVPLPALEIFEMKRWRMGPGAMSCLLGAAWLPQLREIVLDYGSLGDEGAQMLLERASSLSQLHTLSVRVCGVSDLVVSRIGQALPDCQLEAG